MVIRRHGHTNRELIGLMITSYTKNLLAWTEHQAENHLQAVLIL